MWPVLPLMLNTRLTWATLTEFLYDFLSHIHNVLYYAVSSLVTLLTVIIMITPIRKCSKDSYLRYIYIGSSQSFAHEQTDSPHPCLLHHSLSSHFLLNLLLSHFFLPESQSYCSRFPMVQMSHQDNQSVRGQVAQIEWPPW